MTDTAAPSTESIDLLDLVNRINEMNPTNLVMRMGIEFTQAQPDRFVATMPVEGNTQPYGLLHGGASVVLAETLGSIGSDFPVLRQLPGGSAPSGGIQSDFPMPGVQSDFPFKGVPATVKALGDWWAKATGPETALERDLLAWYQRAIKDQASDLARGVPLVVSTADLEAILHRHLADIIGSVAADEAGQIGVSSAPDFSRDVEQALAGYVPQLSASIRQTTIDRLGEIQRVVAEQLQVGVAGGGGVDDVARAIGQLAPEEAGYLAERVARTELASASTRGRMLAWERAQIEEKDWLLAPGACPICAALFAQRPRAKAQEPFARAGETFGGYTLRRDSYGPPLHPNCRCDVVPVIGGL